MTKLARQKKEAPSGPGQPWLNTFADLMNLLLCFFVLLFAMSNIDAEKFDQISSSFASSFGIFTGGGSAIGEGQLISSGVSQLNNLDEYYSNMGQDSSESETDSSGENDTTSPENTADSTDASTNSELQAQMKDQMEKLTEAMYDNIAELSEKSNLGDYVEVGVDPEFRYVQLSLRGSILFDSGKAEIMEQAIPIFSKVGDILKKYNDYSIEIEGHTDNVPMHSTKYENNNWLSSARALNAAEYLIGIKGINPDKLKYSGRGEYEPIASNSTAEGRAKNRRIEIKIYNELSGR